MKKTIFFILVPFIYSCNALNDTVFEINPQNFEDNKLTLSEIACNVAYLPLDNSFPIGISYQLRLANDFIYLSIKDIGIVKFDWNGKVICKIGKKGQGPGEYLYGMQFAVDEKSGNVFVLDRGKVNVYSSEGLFIRDISYEKHMGNVLAGDIECYNSLLFIPDYNLKGDSKYSWVFLDTLGNLIDKKENTVPIFNSNVPRKGNTYRFESRMCYFNYYNDTVFSILPDFSYRGEYVFSKGEYRWPTGQINFASEVQLLSEINKLFQPIQMFETRHYIVLEYAFKSRYALCLIDKKTRKTYLQYRKIKNPDYFAQTIPFVLNDIDGGIPLSEGISYYAVNGVEYLVALINPLDLKTYVSAEEFKSMVPKYPEKKKELERFANSLSETDNPVIMMIKLKK